MVPLFFLEFKGLDGLLSVVDNCSGELPSFALSSESEVAVCESSALLMTAECISFLTQPGDCFCSILMQGVSIVAYC